MIRPDGTIHFVEEFLEILERFLEDYQDIEGETQGDLDRGLVMAFAVSAMRCDLECLQGFLEQQPVFGHLSPTRVLDECSGARPQQRAARLAETARFLRECGWLRSDEHS